MIEPVEPDPETAEAVKPASPRTDPILLEDLASLVRIPILVPKVEQVLRMARAAFNPPEDYPLQPGAETPSLRPTEFGVDWTDADRLLRIFCGLHWGMKGHDPLWEVRLEVIPPLQPDPLRSGGLNRVAARRAESRFREWDRFWHEDAPGNPVLLGASAPCTRFFEHDDPDSAAAEYLGGALHALQVSGCLLALLDAAREEAGTP